MGISWINIEKPPWRKTLFNEYFILHNTHKIVFWESMASFFYIRYTISTHVHTSPLSSVLSCRLSVWLLWLVLLLVKVFALAVGTNIMTEVRHKEYGRTVTHYTYSQRFSIHNHMFMLRFKVSIIVIVQQARTTKCSWSPISHKQ